MIQINFSHNDYLEKLAILTGVCHIENSASNPFEEHRIQHLFWNFGTVTLINRLGSSTISHVFLSFCIEYTKMEEEEGRTLLRDVSFLISSWQCKTDTSRASKMKTWTAVPIGGISRDSSLWIFPTQTCLEVDPDQTSC